MAIKVRNVEALGGHRLAVEFSDGTSGIADLSHHIRRDPYRALGDDGVFRDARVEHGAVEWPRGDVGIATEALYALVHDLPKPATLKQARANELEMSLRELRRLAGKTQVALAEEAGLTQGALSQVERQEDWRLSTLRNYVHALGGELKVVALLGDKEITLRGV
jgi:hypothetical protein